MAENRTLVVNGTDLVEFPDNRVTTTKYNLITFFPYSLFVQFRRVANIYFLVTAILQSIPEISPLHPFNAIAPLVFVLAVAMIREGIEDYLRYKSDQEINATITNVYENGEFEEIPYKDVKVGNLVKVQRDEVFPSDLVMLSNSSENGIAYIETSTLDGEKNLKPRMALAETESVLGIDEIRLFTELVCDPPNPRLYEFAGKMMYEGHMCSLDKNHLLLSGAFLRNTDWVIGVSVYTGNDTKLRQNLMSRRFKQSNIEISVNKYILVIISIEFLLCFFAAVLAGIWVDENDDHWYLGDLESGDLFGFLTFFTYFLLLNTMLPISLIISLEIIKLIQGLAMQRDVRMFSSLKERNCKVSSFSLNEELGMIQHIFTDKTGTLTANKMEFKFCSIGTKRYGEKEGMKKTELKRRASYIDRTILFTFDTHILHEETFTMAKAKQDTSLASQQELNTHFLTCLALCHECLSEREDEKIKYIGQSPDEVALVDFARWADCIYCDTSSNVIELQRDGISLYYERIALFEFNSDRKRNSVIVKSPDERYLMYIKGADNEILKRLAEDNDQEQLEFIRSEIHEFSVRGLRTLVVGYREFSKEEFEEVVEKYNEASTAVDEREEKLEALADELERELELLGCTAVEDALQAEVPATIADCLQAGIKVWMLTGDKLETAENIGKTCCLLDDKMVIKRIEGSDIQKLDKQLRRASSSIDNNQRSRKEPLNQALIIEGASLEYVLFNKSDPEHRMKFPEISNNDELKKICESIRENFFDMALNCKTIICCRASPGEKREVVKAIKNRTKATTLAIGDGANDVSMILEAQIGIGLYGEEGMQAVEASDYAIGEFKFLWELLFLHGRYNYIRQSELIMYFFYKNLVFTLPQFIFMGFCGYSGETVYDDWYITLYNLVFTALPLMFRGLFDVDIIVPTREEICEPEVYHLPVSEQLTAPTKIRKLMPNAYEIGKENKIFTPVRFCLWMLNGCLHSILVFIIPYMAAEEGVLGENGFNHTFGTFTITSFSCVILVVNIKLGLNTRNWNLWVHLAIWMSSILFYFVFVLINDVVTVNFSFLTVSELFSSWYFWGSLILLVFLVLILDGGVELMRRLYWPTDSEILMDYSLKNMEIKPKKNSLSSEAHLVEENHHNG